MEYYKVKQANTKSEIEKNLKGALSRAFHVLVETNVVFVNEDVQFDRAACTSLGYEICESNHVGGVIVANKGDFAFAHFDAPENIWWKRFVPYFVNWLKDKGLNAEFVENDILVDGFKVCGLSLSRHGRIDYTAGFICLNTNLDHIKAICRKPMRKVPKGLSEYGITTEEVEEMFLDFCRADGGGDRK